MTRVKGPIERKLLGIEDPPSVEDTPQQAFKWGLLLGFVIGTIMILTCWIIVDKASAQPKRGLGAYCPNGYACVFTGDQFTGQRKKYGAASECEPPTCGAFYTQQFSHSIINQFGNRAVFYWANGDKRCLRPNVGRINQPTITWIDITPQGVGCG